MKIRRSGREPPAFKAGEKEGEGGIRAFAAAAPSGNLTAWLTALLTAGSGGSPQKKPAFSPRLRRADSPPRGFSVCRPRGGGKAVFSRGALAFVFALGLLAGGGPRLSLASNGPEEGGPENRPEAKAAAREAGDKRKPGQSPKKLNLSETAIGQAAQSGRLEDFLLELEKLKEKRPKDRLEILQAKDSEGSSLFHFLAGGKKRQLEAAGVMLYLAGVLAVHGDFETVDDWNKAGLSPREEAKKSGNSLAVDYLDLAENEAKRQRGEQKGLPGQGKSLDLKQAQALVKSEMWTKFILGAFASLNGWVFMHGGLETGHSGMILFGLPQLLFGVTACYQAFKTSRELKKD